MIARTHNTNGHAGKLPSGIVDRIIELDAAYFERRQDRDAASTYTAGTCDRMNPVPKGIDPLGTDADQKAYFGKTSSVSGSINLQPGPDAFSTNGRRVVNACDTLKYLLEQICGE